jgi:hypothetical protein
MVVIGTGQRGELAVGVIVFLEIATMIAALGFEEKH